jgi:hypothetical protein
MARGPAETRLLIYSRLTVGSLQVTCSSLGINLRRNRLPNGSAHDGRAKSIPTPGAVGIASVREQKTEEVPQTAVDAAPLPKIAIRMRYRGNEVATDVPLTSDAISTLALDAMSRDLGIAELVGQILAAAIKKDMIEEILRDEARRLDSVRDAGD